MGVSAIELVLTLVPIVALAVAAWRALRATVRAERELFGG